MYFCSKYDENTLQCLSWLDASSLFAVESGIGLQLGLMLFGVAISAWCIRAVAMLILNK